MRPIEQRNDHSTEAARFKRRRNLFGAVALPSLIAGSIGNAALLITESSQSMNTSANTIETAVFGGLTLLGWGLAIPAVHASHRLRELKNPQRETLSPAIPSVSNVEINSLQLATGLAAMSSALIFEAGNVVSHESSPIPWILAGVGLIATLTSVKKK